MKVSLSSTLNPPPDHLMSVNPATAHSLLLRATHVDTQMNYYDDWRRLFFNLYGSKIKKNCVSSFVSAGGSRPWHSHHSPHTHTHTDTVQVQWSVFGVLWHLYGGGRHGRRARERERKGGYHGNWSSKILQRCIDFTAWCGMNKNHPVSELRSLTCWLFILESLFRHIWTRLDADV